MQQAFIVGISKFFFGFPRKKTKQNKNQKCLIATRSVILLVYIYEQNIVKVVMKSCSHQEIKNTTLIQWHKLKKETPSISYINMLNEIIPGHALKIRAQLFKGRLALAWG